MIPKHHPILTISQRIIHRSSYFIGIEIHSFQSSSDKIKLLTKNSIIQSLYLTGESGQKKTERYFRSVFFCYLLSHIFFFYFRSLTNSLTDIVDFCTTNFTTTSYFDFFDNRRMYRESFFNSNSER